MLRGRGEINQKRDKKREKKKFCISTLLSTTKNIYMDSKDNLEREILERYKKKFERD